MGPLSVAHSVFLDACYAIRGRQLVSARSQMLAEIRLNCADQKYGIFGRGVSLFIGVFLLARSPD